MKPRDETCDVLVVGAGQAGLALGQQLAGQRSGEGPGVLLVDAAQRIGTTWRRRWDSLRLFTPAGYSALAGLPWQRTAGSALLGWVGHDTRLLAEHVMRQHRRSARGNHDGFA